MRTRLRWLIGSVTVVGCIWAGVRPVLATPASGFTSTSLAVGRVGDFAVMHTLVLDDGSANCPAGQPPSPRPASFFVPTRDCLGWVPMNHPLAVAQSVWQSTQNTKGDSDLYVQSNVWVAGGTTGWHTHPGHSLITVTAGTVTAYEGNEPTCTPKVYTVGMTFVDEGGDHVHVIRNEGAVEARTITVQLLPAGATRRIDASANPACSF